MRNGPARFRRSASVGALLLVGGLLALLLVVAGWGRPATTPAVVDLAGAAEADAAAVTSATPATVQRTEAPLSDRLAVADVPEPVATLAATLPPASAAPETTPTPAAPALPTAIAPTPIPIPTQPPVVEGPPRIGLQVGHWRIDELPEELTRLRGASGGSGGGRQEWQVNLEVAERLAERLRARGYSVDVLPATVPPGYLADVFLSIHADANASPGPRGFKVARSRWSRLPATDDALVETLRAEYGQATGLPWDDAITRNMTGYYAFNNRRREHAIDKRTPGAILEMGYLTNAADRAVLFNQVDVVVEGIERGLVRFLEGRPPLAEREQPAAIGNAVIINEGGATVRSSPSLDAPVLAQIEGGRRQEAPDIRGEWYGVWIAERGGPGWVHRSEATLVQVTLP